MWFSIPSYEEYSSMLRKACRDLGVEPRVIGRSREGREIIAIEVGRGRARVAVVAGQHGSEPAPPLAVARFLTLLSSDKGLRRELEDCKFLLIPLANPDGFSRLRECLEECGAPSWKCECSSARLLTSGEDMNRDWLFLRNPETQAVHKALNEFDPHVVLDLHEFYAVGGAPPRWAHETEGFDAYVTDAPYAGVSPEVQVVSKILAEEAMKGVKEASGFKTVLRRVCVAEPIEPSYLGVHAPLEGAAKVLVETWGVGLGSYLLYERVSAHLEVIRRVASWCSRNYEVLERVKELDRDFDRLCWEKYAAQSYVVSGEGLEEASRILRSHGVLHDVANGKIVVSRDRPPRYSRIALHLLEPRYVAGTGRALLERVGVEVRGA